MKKGILIILTAVAIHFALLVPVAAQNPTTDPNQPVPTLPNQQPGPDSTTPPTATPVPPTPVPPTPTSPPANVPQVPGRGGTTGGSDLPKHISTANCDVCGYCKDMTADQIPDRWKSCQQCVYRGFGEDIDPTANKTLQGTEAGIPTPDLFHIYTDFGCLSTQPGEFAAQISSFFFSIVGGISFLFFIYGAGLIATSRSDPGRLNHGKRVIYGAIVGLLFALFSVFIIRFVATGIGLPGIGG